jgi:amino acid transporter
LESKFNRRIKNIVIGKARDPHDRALFRDLSLIAFFAWVGLGADGLSSSSYGPEEAFRTLGSHYYLSLIVGFGTVVTIFIISTSYSQIIELFPTGGGGYLVSSKLLSPTFGMISGSALLIDYVLTITVSVASGADAIFSFLPTEWHAYKLEYAILAIIVLSLMNMRGVKESIIILMPIFLTFIATHIFAILYTVFANAGEIPQIISATKSNIHSTTTQLGIFGTLFILLKSYSMGAGTFTGIEAVSNGLQILREPRVATGRRTMVYMSASLAFMVVGLMFGYLIYRVEPVSGKTLNAVFFENLTRHWGNWTATSFVLITLISEGALLFVAAQTGFIDGPRVMANMALDQWFPNRFATLSDRFVTQNGIFVMGTASVLMLIISRGSVQFLVVLYSINVFVTFVLSQTGMVRHWWQVRKEEKKWKRKITINGIGLVLCSFVLITVSTLKFYEGGWLTIVVTGCLILVVSLVKRHYKQTRYLLRRLDALVADIETAHSLTHKDHQHPNREFDKNSKTAIFLVSGFNGIGLHTLFSVIRTFGKAFQNFVFIQVGVVDAGNFKGYTEIEKLQVHIKSETEKYVNLMKSQGYFSAGISLIGVDVVEEIVKLTPKILEQYPNAVFFGGQLVFPKESIFSRWLHNYTIFSVQRQLYSQGIPVMIMPIRVY